MTDQIAAIVVNHGTVDLMRRLHASGWGVLYQPQAHYFTRAYGRGGALAIAGMLWPAARLNILHHILHRGLRGKTPTVPRRFSRDHWLHVIRPLVFAGCRT